MNGTMITQSYQFNPAGKNWLSQWKPEKGMLLQIPYKFDPRLTTRKNAAILADVVIGMLVQSYSSCKIDVNPRAVPIWGDGIFGAEVYYHNQLGTMKISARVQC